MVSFICRTVQHMHTRNDLEAALFRGLLVRLPHGLQLWLRCQVPTDLAGGSIRDYCCLTAQ